MQSFGAQTAIPTEKIFSAVENILSLAIKLNRYLRIPLCFSHYLLPITLPSQPFTFIKANVREVFWGNKY